VVNLGTVRPGSTIYIPFDTFAGATGAPITLTGLAVADVKIYKDGGTTERASTSGFTLLDTDGIDFDSLTGIHGVSIDLADNTTANFYTAGSRYFVVIGDVTVDSQTLRFVAATFRIGYEGAILDTTIATLASQTSFTLTAGSADNSAYVGCVAVLHDVASAVQVEMGVVSAYTGSTKTVTLASDPGIFTVAAGDNISFYPRVSVHAIAGTAQTARDIGASVLLSPGTGTGQISLTSGAVLLQATQTGVTIPTVTTLTNLPSIPANWLTAAGIAASALNGKGDWNVGKTGYALTATTGLGNQTANITGNLSGSVGSVTGAVGSVTAAVTAGTVSDKTGYSLTATTGLGNQTANITGNLSGSVGSVTGAVGSVTGAVGSVTGAVGSVTGAVGSIGTGGIASTSFATGAITATAIAADAIGASELAADAATEIGAAVWATAARTLTAGTNIALAKGTGITGFNDLDAGGVATAVWNAATATYGSAGSYGLLIETNLDAQVSTVGGGSLTVGGIADAVWDEILSGHAISGSTGEALNAAGGAGDPWITALPGSYSAGQAGYILGTNLNATVSSRSTYAGGDTSGTTTLLSRLTSTRAGYLDNIATAAPSAATIASQVRTELTTELARIDAATSTRLATASYTAPLDAAGVRSAVGLATDNLDTQLSAIDTVVDSILDDTGTAGVVVASGSKTGYSLAAAGLDAIVVETGLNARQALAVNAAALAGVLSGAATTTVTVKGAGVATTRITATVDADGNRSAVTLALPS
jgi:hypothetical protein